MFVQIEGGTCLLMSKGVWKPADLYSLEGFVFAKLGSGFIKLKRHGATSKADHKWEHLDTEPVETIYSATGNMMLVEAGKVGKK